MIVLWIALLFAPLSIAQETADPAALRQRLQELLDVRARAQLASEFFPHVRRGGALAEDGLALAIVARAAIETGGVKDAEALLENARVKSGQTALEIEKARVLFAKDELQAASRALVSEDPQGTRLRFPDEPEAWILFARTHARLQDYENAEKAARNYLQRAPYGRESATAWQIRTDGALRRNDGDGAHQCLKQAKRHRRWHELLFARRIQHRRDPEAELPQLGLGLLWMEAEQYDKARAVLFDLVQRKPEFCRGWFHLGESERMLGHAAKAEAAYDRALRCDGEHAPSRANRAALRLARVDLIGARLDLEALLAGPAGKDPRYVESHLQLARVLLQHEAPAEARARYELYRELGGKAPLEP